MHAFERLIGCGTVLATAHVLVLMPLLLLLTTSLLLLLIPPIRLWVSPPVDRPLPAAYEEIYGGSVEVGNRGGIHVADTKECIVLEAE